MPEPLVVTTMRSFRQAIIAREQEQMRLLAVRWLGVEERLRAEIQALVDGIALARSQGTAVNRASLYQMRHYRAVLAQLQHVIGTDFLPYAEDMITAGQRQAIQDGIAHAEMAIQQAMFERNTIGATFDRLPAEALETMVGMTANGAPVSDLLRAAYPEAAGAMTDALLDGVARGHNPRVTAAAMARASGMGLQRAMVIARTEQLRAYREAGRAAYQESGVVDGFYRLCAHDSRVCPACLAREGEFIPLSAGPLREHPQGRCSMVPKVRGLPPLTFTAGESWFRLQIEADQIAILGPRRFQAWRDGQVRFGDFAQTVPNAVWGDSLRTPSLAELGIAGEGDDE